MKQRIILVISFFACLQLIYGQSKLKPYEAYIEQYASIAVDQQTRYGIPASITLAQGLLESGAGLSELAKKSNNHFGIKCHKDWKGQSVTFFDDGENACFRKYKKVADSYDDHSQFLVNGARYRFLFELKTTDYKGWAKGLSKAGYATDVQYADKLIRIIETYDLNRFAKEGGETKSVEKVRVKTRKPVGWFGRLFRKDTTNRSSNRLQGAKDYHAMEPVYTKRAAINPMAVHPISYIGTTPCITVRYGDSFASIAEEFGISIGRLRKINEVTDQSGLIPGETLFLDDKTTWWEGEEPFHIVKTGETMYQIAQQYALKLKALYELNDLKPGTPIKTGQRILLRNPDKMSPFVKAINEALNKQDTTNMNQ